MTSIRGVITFPGKDKAFEVVRQGIGTFQLDLSGGEWVMGIDQSTSCTGICLEQVDGSVRILLDVERDKNLEVRVFYRDLFKILVKLASGQKFKYVVMERPAPKAMYASRVLQELKGRLEEWADLIPEFYGVPIDALYPQVWKSYVIDKSKGKNRHKDKRAVAEDLCDKIPSLSWYLGNYRGLGFDSFDACGILYAYRRYAFTEDGRPKIHGVIEKTHVSLVGYRWVSQEDFSLESLGMENWFKVYNPPALAFNEKYSLHDNIRMASSSHKVVVCAIPKKYLEKFMWQYDIDIDDESMMMIMFILRKGQFSNSEINVFKSYVPWNEEVFSD